MQTLLRKELREQWRTHRILVVAAVLSLFGLLGPLSVKYLPLIMARMPGVPEGLAEGGGIILKSLSTLKWAILAPSTINLKLELTTKITT